MDQDAGGAEDEERKARELSKFSSQLLTEHAAPGTLVKVVSPSLPRWLAVLHDATTHSRHFLLDCCLIYVNPTQ